MPVSIRSTTVADLENRFFDHLRKLRSPPDKTPPDGADAESEQVRMAIARRNFRGDLPKADVAKIKARAGRIVAARAAASGLSHLKSDEVEWLSVLRHGVRLPAMKSEDQAAAALAWHSRPQAPSAAWPRDLRSA